MGETKKDSFWKHLTAGLLGAGLVALGGLVPVTAPYTLTTGGALLLASGTKLLGSDKKKAKDEE